jgi:hypothetical protein
VSNENIKVLLAEYPVIPSVFEIRKFGKRIPINSIIGIEEILRVVELPKKEK